MSKRSLPLLLALVSLGLFLQGCTNSPGVELGAIALASPFLSPTGNICIDSPAEAYANGVSTCDTSTSPLQPSNVNSPWRSSNGYCALEWALVYDRLDIVREALAKGADPFKCEPRGFPLFTALRQVEDKYGRERLRFYLDLFKGTKALDRQAGAKFIRFGIESRALEFIGYGLEAGHPVDAGLNVDYQVGRFKDIYIGKSPLYVASVKFLMMPEPVLAGPVEFLVQHGARVDPAIDAYVAEHQSTLKPGAVERLQGLLKP